MIAKSKIQVLYSKQELRARVKELAEQISSDYKDSNNLILIGVLKGAFVFLADLMREISVDCQVEFIRLSSYDQGTTSSGKVKSIDLTLPDLTDKDVLIVEDIIDSGRTAKFLVDFFKTQNARTIKLATLFDKPSRRIKELQEIKADYTCFEIEDKFILGYGLDFEQKYRDLPYVGFIE
ncbi:MAG: hypoxanthine phosphoribosyltransferase [Cyanobacteria bacterium]|nr:hypoxanthine phosphoribosyltransferase [Cyanobacteriota bacterium]MDA1020169.1 hypoxanthine phosphoribosyltransferase [Cyanobacteriota bacterium]